MKSAEPAQYPCRARPGNTWYEFRSHGHTIGLSDAPGRTLRLQVDETDTQVTLAIVDETGVLATDSEGDAAALAITKPLEAP